MMMTTGPRPQFLPSRSRLDLWDGLTRCGCDLERILDSQLELLVFDSERRVIGALDRSDLHADLRRRPVRRFLES